MQEKNNKLLIDGSISEEIRIALIDENEKLKEYSTITGLNNSKPSLGNIYLGIVEKIEPSINVAFVKITNTINGFLPFSDIHPDYYVNNGKKNIKIKDVIKKNTPIIVQVKKEATQTKCASLTTYISLIGKNCILFPNTENSNGISRNINGENRKRLKEFLQTLKNSFSLIIRTSSNASSIEEIKEDYYNLHKTWLNISEQAKNKRRPSILLEEDLFLKKLREYSKYNIKSALIEGKNLYEKIKQYCEKKMIEFPYIELEHNIFRHIENQVEQLYSSKIGLPSGGTIVIEHTEALTAIDVNSKNSLREKNIEATALKTNIEAAHEIARQIILRNIGGLIVIDFIDMFKEEDIGDINKIIKKAFKEDKAITSVIGCSTFGIMQISRQRLSPSIVEKSFTQCKACSSGLELKTESSALNLLRKIGNEYNQIDKKHHIIKIYTTDKIIQTLLNDYFKTLSKYANIKWELVCDNHPMYNKIEVVK
jgi:ribonuclease E